MSGFTSRCLTSPRAASPTLTSRLPPSPRASNPQLALPTRTSRFPPSPRASHPYVALPTTSRCFAYPHVALPPRPRRPSPVLGALHAGAVLERGAAHMPQLLRAGEPRKPYESWSSFRALAHERDAGGPHMQARRGYYNNCKFHRVIRVRFWKPYSLVSFIRADRVGGTLGRRPCRTL